MTRIHNLNLERIAAEVTACHHIRVDPDDPMMTVVTINRLIFESAVEEALAQIRGATQEFDQSLQQFQLRVGGAVGREVRKSLNEVRTKKNEGVITLHWNALLALGALTLGVGVWAGSLLR